MNEWVWVAKDLNATNSLASCIAESVLKFLSQDNGLVICLDGSLGAGKTTLTTALCVQLGVNPTEISSPTFSLQNIYVAESAKIQIPIYHYDLYRLNDESELLETGFEEHLCLTGLHLVEWASKFSEAIPQNAVLIDIQHHTDTSRIFSIRSSISSIVTNIAKCVELNEQVL